MIDLNFIIVASKGRATKFHLSERARLYSGGISPYSILTVNIFLPTMLINPLLYFIKFVKITIAMEPENLTIQQLRRARWYLEHKQRLKSILTIFLIILDVVIWGWTIYQTVIYFSSTKSYEEMLRGLTMERINYLEMHKHFQPLDLEISDVKMLSQDKNQYDFIVEVKNPDEKWMVTSIEYNFILDGENGEVQKTFILPNQTKYLFQLGQKLASRPQNMQFVIKSIRRQRVRSEQKAVLEIISKLIIKDIKFTYTVPEEKMVAVPQLSFTIENQSVYGFWEAPLIIAMYQQNQLASLNTLVIKNLKAGETRLIEFNWPSSLPAEVNISIQPDINVFDQTAFMPIGY